MGLAPIFGEAALVLSVRAPFAFGPGWAWYRLHADGSADLSQYHESVALLNDLLKEVATEAPVVLLGFSQGAMMSAGLAVHRKGAGLHGVISLSAPPLPEPAAAETLKGLPVFWGHGTRDPVVPIDRGEDALRRLQATGAKMSVHRYPIVHTISEEELDDMQRWFIREKLTSSE